ncbi:hypothetical protein KZ291_33500, partial [Escherichia coli]|nr:hypothetical protein [Escherichia coli]
PSTVQDAYLMLREAIDSPDPVVFFEPKKLYWTKDQVDLEDLARQYEAQRAAKTEGTARIARPGTDATLVAYGPSVSTALE